MPTREELLVSIDCSIGRLRSDSNSGFANRMMLKNLPKSLQAPARKLSPVALMFLDYVAENRGATPAELMDFLQVSKGAISQNAQRLTHMDLLTAYKLDDNLKAIHYAATDDGRQIGTAHRTARDVVHQRERESLADCADSEVAAIDKFLLNVVDIMR